MISHRTKAIISVLLVILTVSGCYLFFFVNQQKQNQNLLVESKKELVSTLATTLTRQIDKQYSSRVRSFVTIRKKQIQAFLDRDRETLYATTFPLFKVLQEENSYFDHINFILPDNTIFLRMHDPKQYGDEERHLVQHDSEINVMSYKFTSGFFYGACGLYYQVSHPVYNEGEYAGAVLFGIRIGSFLEKIQKNFGLHTALALLKNRQEGEWHQENGVDSGNYIIYHQNDALFSLIAQEFVVSAREQKVDFEGSILNVFSSYVIKDMHGDELGRILQALDVTSITKSFRHDLYRLALITMIVLVVATMILYLSFNKLLVQLIQLNETLNRKNDELVATGRKLEHLVAERTNRLAETNKQLQLEIVKRQDINRSLTRSVEEWQSTFDAIIDPVTILDNNLEIVIANKALHSLLSSGEKVTVGRKCYELFAGRSSSCTNCPVREVFEKGKKQEGEVEHNYLGRSLFVSCAPILDGEEIMGFVHTARDITQEKELKKQLFQAQKMEAIATLAGGIAHDFNNILGAILGNADLLLYRISSLSKRDELAGTSEVTIQDVESHLAAIKKAGNRAKELVSQILAFSRQGKSQRQNADITPVIKEGIKLLRSSLPANIEIKTAVDSKTCQVFADLTQIHQVFMNLCTNAAQAMHEYGGILDISLSLYEHDYSSHNDLPNLQRGRYVVLSVRDTGHGMSPAVMERIFDPFFTTRDVSEGTGMGLAVIHGIITAHDGDLDVQSEEGVGSAFAVYLPCQNGPEGGEEDVILGVPRGNQEKILFVDDEKDIVRMTTRMLEYLGYVVYPASKAEQAIAMLRRESFDIDLVITDYSMTGVSGVELAKEIVAMGRDIPVMLCSGFSESVILDEEARDIIRKFMSKPLDMNKLAVAIREVLPATAGENNAGSDN